MDGEITLCTRVNSWQHAISYPLMVFLFVFAAVYSTVPGNYF
jgi:hypothetical protein